jgi:hypothetical protein
MTTIEEKEALKPSNYYNEISSYTKKIHYHNVEFLGIEDIYGNKLLCFRLQNGKYYRRQLLDDSSYFVNVLKENDDHHTNEENSIVEFNEINESREKSR